jgi:hypothetical protein
MTTIHLQVCGQGPYTWVRVIGTLHLQVCGQRPYDHTAACTPQHTRPIYARNPFMHLDRNPFMHRDGERPYTCTPQHTRQRLEGLKGLGLGFK